MVFVVGKSGCGKSTLLNILGGLDKPTSGEVIFEGKKVCYDKEEYLDEYRKNHIGFVFQDHLLVDDLTVKENVKNVIDLQGKNVSDDEILSVLKSVGIDDIADKLPNTLSGGQRQRVAIARALIKKPSVILADEPTGNLDSESGKIVFDILKEISKTTLVIVVSHDLDSAYRYADRIIELKDGEVLSDKQKTTDFDLDELKRQYNEAIDKSYTATTENISLDTISADMDSAPKTKSQLSAKNAFKTMWGWLKASFLKPKNLITTLVTIFVLSLSIAALGMFNNIRMFDFEGATSNGLHNAKYNTVMLLKKDILNTQTEKEDEKENEDITFSDAEISRVKESFSGAYKTYLYNYDFQKYIDDKDDYFSASLSGFCELNETVNDEDLNNFFNAKLIAGRYPRKNKNAVEILISDFTAESIIRYGGRFDNGIVFPSRFPEELIGKTFEDHSVYFKIVGIYECQFSHLFKEKVSKDNAEFSFAKNYVFPIGLCAKDAVISMVGSVIGVGIAVELKPVDDEMFLSYNCQFLAVNSYDEITKISDSNGIEIKYSTGFDNDFNYNDIIISFSRYLDVFNLYEYSDEGELISSFNDLTAESLENLTIAENYNGKTTNYRLVGVFDDSSTSKELTIISSVKRNEHLEGLLQTPTVYVSLTGNDPTKLMNYCKNNNLNIVAVFSERLYFFSILFSMLEDTITIATAVILLFVVMLLAIIIGRSLRERSKDIGILRALGANRRDIVKIFLLNDLFYIITSFTFSVALYFIGIAVFNASISSQFGVSVVILSGNVYSILIMLLISVVVVFTASYLPIRKYSSVPPIDVIRGNE